MLCADVVGQCVVVATISAYRDWPHAAVDERSALWDEQEHSPGPIGRAPLPAAGTNGGRPVAHERFTGHAIEPAK